MNPFSMINKTKSTISILSTNIRGLASGTREETNKLKVIFDLGADINIIIDSHLDNNKMRTLMKGNSQLLSRYNHQGSLSRLRGIDIFIKKACGVKLKNLSILSSGNHLHGTLIMPDPPSSPRSHEEMLRVITNIICARPGEILLLLNSIMRKALLEEMVVKKRLCMRQNHLVSSLKTA